MDVGDVDAKAEKLLIPVDLKQYPSNAEFAATLLKKVPKGVHNVLIDFIARLYAVYVDCQFTYLEINPLVVTPAGEVIAVDAKMVIDDNELDRRANIAGLRDESSEEPSEVDARKSNLTFIKLDGNVGCVVNGAGLAMATMDLVKYYGGEPANFLDIGGGASAEVMAAGLHVILSDPQVKSIFVNVFGGITACDEVANGIVQALQLLKDKGEEVTKPLVVRLDGNNVVEGRRILEEAAHPLVTLVDTMDCAARKAAELAAAK